MLTPKTIHDDLHEHHTQVVQLFSKHPWLIPATTLLHIIPVVVGINGFWKSRALSKQLKIEREKTKQLALQQVDKVQSAVTSHHCQHPIAANSNHVLINPLTFLQTTINDYCGHITTVKPIESSRWLMAQRAWQRDNAFPQSRATVLPFQHPLPES